MNIVEYRLPINLKHIFIIFFKLGLFVAFFEFIISPHPHYAKKILIFPAFKFLGFTFTIFEFFTLSFILLFTFLIFLKFILNSELPFNFAPSRFMNWLVLIFIINVVFALLIGFSHNNEDFFGQFRNLVALFVIFPFYYFRQEIFKSRKFIFFFINGIGLYFVIFTILNNFFDVDLIFVSGNFSKGYYGLYISGFFYAYHLSKILFEKKAILSIFFVLISLLAFISRSFQKPMMLEILVITTLILIMYKFIYKKKIIKFLFFSFLAFFLVNSSIFLVNKDLRIFEKTFERWTKIKFDEDISKIDAIKKLGDIKVSGSKDISAGRFIIWKNYILEGIKYPIVTPYFGTKGPDIIYKDSVINRPAHNIFAHYVYKVGLPAALCVLGLILLFIIKGWKWIKHQKYTLSSEYLKQFEAIAIYVFVIGIIATEFVGGVIDRSEIISWFFWTLVVIFFLNFEKIKISKLKD